jgi:hypothetical protein
MRKIPSSKTLAVASAALVVAGSGSAAIASSRGEERSPSSFLDAVARHLGVSRDELDEATKAAALEGVDAALAAGEITDEQAEALKARIESGEGPPFFRPGFRGGPPGMHAGMHPFGAHLSAAAGYLDLDVGELRERLSRGQSLADVAEAEDKSVDGLEEALLDDAERRLGDAVEDGLLTDAQAAMILDRLRSHIDAIVSGELPRWRGPHRGPPAFPRL